MSETLPQDANENSLWGANAIAAPRAEQLRASLRVDVLVVGAGYTGLSSALHLAEKGVSVVLLEASSIGFGGSGRNAGLVNAGIWKNPELVRKLLGAAAAERFNAALCDTPAPLPDEVAASVIPERQGLWDTHTLLTSSRIDEQGRLVMSSPGRLQGGQRAIRQNWMTRKRDTLYPQLRGTRWAYHWSGCIGVTSTRILRVQVPAPGLFAPAGYNGRGIGTGTALGKYLADTVASGNRDDFPFPIETLQRENWPALRSAYYDYGTLALQFVDNRW